MALDWPTSVPIPAFITPQLIWAMADDPSPFTGSDDPSLRFQAWHFLLEWRATPINGYLAAVGFFSRSRGGVTLYKIPVLHGRAKRGSKSGTVTLNGAHAAGVTSLTVTGGSGTFLLGDWFYYNQATNVPRAHVVTSSEVAGVIQIDPGLRVALSTGTQLFHQANGEIYDTMKLAMPEYGFGRVEVMPIPTYGEPFSLEFVSALRRNL